MDAISEVEHRGTGRELEQVATWREHVDVVWLQRHLELVHHLKVVACLQRGTYVGKPFVHLATTFYALVAPVGREAMLGYVVHSLGAYLHLHPFVLRTKHSNVQALVTIRLGHR